MRIHVFLIIVISNSFLFYSCKKEKNKRDNIAVKEVQSKTTQNDLKPELIYNKTFYKVTKTDSVDILYHYCDAGINTIKVYKDSIWEDFGQEDYTMLVDRISVNGKKIVFHGKLDQVTPEKLYSFEIENESKGYWQINNRTFIDSIKISGIKQYKEPDSECF